MSTSLYTLSFSLEVVPIALASSIHEGLTLLTLGIIVVAKNSSFTWARVRFVFTYFLESITCEKNGIGLGT